jgi:outer membrane protein OmpA-like peptidoglycan-associated protein
MLNSFVKFQGHSTTEYTTLKDTVCEVNDKILLDGIFYEKDSCGIVDSLSGTQLKEVAAFMNRNKNITIIITNFVDYSDQAIDIANTRCRSKAVCEYLRSAGIDEHRLNYMGYGASVPFQLQQNVVLPSGKIAEKGKYLNEKYLSKFKSNAQDCEFLRALNRRTELMVVSTNYKQ